jgi:hypothetical protein
MVRHTRPVSRSLATILTSLVALLANGCQTTSTLVGAVVCQGFGTSVALSPAQEWRFPGLSSKVPPRIRPGTYASATYGVRFVDLDSLGAHRYWLDGGENNGIVYTCAGGHIDIAHVRKAADWTGFLAAVTLEHLHRGETTFRFKLWEPSLYFVDLTYPQGWSSLPTGERERIARVVSGQLGQYLAYTAMTWHEILTWFGFRPKGYKSEFPSAFSWEDSYSNLLGTCVAAEALQDPDRPFSEAVTAILRQHLESLGAQPASVARQASEVVRGDWYSKRWLFTVIGKRILDIGSDDGQVTPSLVPRLSACGDERLRPLSVPTCDDLSRYGFSATVTIEPRVWEQGRILKALHAGRKPVTTRIDPPIHFPLLIDYLKQDMPSHHCSDTTQTAGP